MSARTSLDPNKLVDRYMRTVLASHARRKTAGEVRFIKDRSDDAGQWAFSPPGASKREPTKDFEYDQKHLKPIAKSLRATNSALGFTMSAYNEFVKMASRHVSGDGLLGGKGYVQKISDMRRQYMNVLEALSAMSDTLRDEVSAPHWAEASRDKKVKEDLAEAKGIKDDPEEWAEDEMEG